MKKGIKKVIALVLVCMLSLSVCSVGFVSFAEEQQAQFAMPGIQAILTDGNAFKSFLETNFLNLETLDKLLAENLPGLSENLCAMLGDLFYQMGYNEQQYPTDEAGLALALARALSSLDAEVFREPERIETTDLSLIYHFGFIDGTDYIESVNAALPESVRFSTTQPLLSLSKSQMAEISEYYARWKAGDIRLDDFDVKNYLGDLAPEQFLKAVLLVFIADDNRLPAITAKAIDFELTPARKAALAVAVADIMDNLHTKPVSALLRQLGNPDFQAVLRPLLVTANKVTIRTDYYSYHIFNEGIYTDTDGSLAPGVVDNGDGTYSYMGTGYVSEYLELADAVFALLNGADAQLQNSILQTLLDTKLGEFKTVVLKAIKAVIATTGAERNKLLSDIRSAEIEKRFAQKEIANINSGAYQSSLIAQARNRLDEIQTAIAPLQARLLVLENEEAAVLENNRGYYEALAELESTFTSENQAQLEGSEEYLAAKARVEEVEAFLSENRAEQENLLSRIASLSEEADDVAQEIYRLQHAFYPEDAKSVYQTMITAAEKVISESNSALSALPDESLSQEALQMLESLIDSLFDSLDGVYAGLMNDSPIKALAVLIAGLKGFAEAVEQLTSEENAAVMDPVFAEIDAFINESVGRYISQNGGENLLADLETGINEVLDTYGVMSYLNLSSLDSFLSQDILGDHSETMCAAAAALGEIFPNVQPTYESIVSCLIPILSAFNFSELMANMDDIGSALSLASPSAFAYLAGMSDTNLTTGYLATVNANLAAIGYTGEPVIPIISLTSSQRSALSNYVAMEANGYTLSQIASSGFSWSNYTGSTSHLAIANALIKIALGDESKLGEIATAPGIGKALANLLCDLLDDLKASPAKTILKKLSASEDLAALADFALNLLYGGFDESYKSYELYFEKNIFYDAEGNTVFYDYIDDNGDLAYRGPRAMQYYLPIIAAGLDLLDGIYDDVMRNDGDLLKTVLFDKVPQIKNLIKSFITYTDAAGEQQAGALFYLLFGYEDYLKSENTKLSYDLLISLVQFKIRQTQSTIAEKEVLIEIWNQYLEQAHAAEDAAKLAKAKELGVLDETAVLYSDEVLESAVAAKTAQLEAQAQALQELIIADEVAVTAAEESVAAAQEQMEEYSAKVEEMTDNEEFFEAVAAIIEDGDLSCLDELRQTYAEWFDDLFGEGNFALLESYLVDYYESVENADEFFETYLYYEDGLNLVGVLDEMDAALVDMMNEETGVVAQANEKLTQDIIARNTVLSTLDDYETGAVTAQVHAAANGLKICISDNILQIDGTFTVAQIASAAENVRSTQIAPLEAAITEQEALLETYAQEQAQVGSTAFNAMLVPLAAEASDALAQGVTAFLSGNQADGSENVYYYIMDRRIADIFTTSGRIEALFDALLAVYEPVLRVLVSEGLLADDTARQLIAAVPSFEVFKKTALKQFPNAFKANPVGATGALIAALCTDVLNGFGALEGELTHDAMQVKKINRDLIALFDEDFGSDWLASYSRALVNRAVELQQLLADLLGLEFVQNLLGGTPDTKGSISGKIDPSKVYSDVTVFLYKGDEVIASVVITKDSDGSFEFSDVEEGNYVIKMSARSSLPVVIKAVDVLGEGTTDLSDSRDDAVVNLVVPVGDTDGNGKIDINDITNVLDESNYGSDNEQCDINCDGLVDISDLSIIMAEGNYAAQPGELAF